MKIDLDATPPALVAIGQYLTETSLLPLSNLMATLVRKRIVPAGRLRSELLRQSRAVPPGRPVERTILRILADAAVRAPRPRARPRRP